MCFLVNPRPVVPQQRKAYKVLKRVSKWDRNTARFKWVIVSPHRRNTRWTVGNTKHARFDRRFRNPYISHEDRSWPVNGAWVRFYHTKAHAGIYVFLTKEAAERYAKEFIDPMIFEVEIDPKDFLARSCYDKSADFPYQATYKKVKLLKEVK